MNCCPDNKSPNASFVAEDECCCHGFESLPNTEPRESEFVMSVTVQYSLQ